MFLKVKKSITEQNYIVLNKTIKLILSLISLIKENLSECAVLRTSVPSLTDLIF